MKLIIPFLVLLLFIFGCSDSDSNDTQPVVPECVSDFTSLTLSATYAYTGDTYSISGSKFCNAELTAILINDLQVTITETTDTKISFVMPLNLKDSVSVKIKTKTAVIDLKKKMAVFPGNGDWKEVQPFPGTGRGRLATACVGTKGYLTGGERYTGYNPNVTPAYGFTRFNELYEYNATANTWTLLETNDQLKEKVSATYADGKLFTFSEYVSGPVTTYDPIGKTFGTAGNFSAGLSLLPFTVGNIPYYCNVNTIDKMIYISKYNPANKTWTQVKNISYTNGANNDPYLNFVMTNGDKFNIGYSFNNEKTVYQLSYDPASNELNKLEVAFAVATSYTPRLKHLFTINSLAYFIELGAGSVGPNSASLDAPGKILYIYNLKANAWRTSVHTYPEFFFGVSSFTLNNRGFAGLSQSVASPLFAYSQKFYEFTAK